MVARFCRLVVNWTFTLTISFNYFVTFAVQSEAKMNSVERVVHYIDTLEPEPDIETKPDKKHVSEYFATHFLHACFSFAAPFASSSVSTTSAYAPAGDSHTFSYPIRFAGAWKNPQHAHI
jgi:hypothetical protein